MIIYQGQTRLKPNDFRNDPLGETDEYFHFENRISTTISIWKGHTVFIIIGKYFKQIPGGSDMEKKGTGGGFVSLF